MEPGGSILHSDHYSSQEITSFFSSIRPGSNPSRVSFLVDVFLRDFPSTVRRISGNLGHICPRASFDIIIIQKPFRIRLWTATVSGLSCSTWSSLNIKNERIHESSPLIPRQLDQIPPFGYYFCKIYPNIIQPFASEAFLIIFYPWALQNVSIIFRSGCRDLIMLTMLVDGTK